MNSPMRRAFQTIREFPRRLHELLGVPQALGNLAAQNDRLNQRVDEMSRQLGETAQEFAQHMEELKRISAQSSRVTEMQRELGEELSAEIAFAFHDLERFTQEKYAELSAFAGAVDGRHAELTALAGAFAAKQAELSALGGAIQARQGELKSEFTELLARMHAAIEATAAAAGNKQSETANLLAHLNTSLQSRMNELSTSQFELTNLISHLQSSSEVRLAAFENAAAERRNVIDHLSTSLHSRLNKVENVEIPALGQEIHELMAVQLQALAGGRNQAQRSPLPLERYKRAEPQPFNSYLLAMKEAFPRAYPLWNERLEATRQAFVATPVGNAAHAGDVYSRIFRSLVEVHACGRVLDVGCGVFGRPYYLASYPPDLLSGLDPLKPTVAPDFEFVRGISEQLPWPDGSFSTVISATALDHCMSLDRSLAEVDRVLTPGGRFLLWIASIPGATKFNPEDADPVAADRFHLFHLDSAWLDPILLQGFDTLDRLEFRKPGYSHVMYCLAKKTDMSLASRRTS